MGGFLCLDNGLDLLSANGIRVLGPYRHREDIVGPCSKDGVEAQPGFFAEGKASELLRDLRLDAGIDAKVLTQPAPRAPPLEELDGGPNQRASALHRP